MKRSIRAVTTGSGTEPSSSTPSWNARILNLKLAHSPTCSSLPSRLYLDHSHGPVLAPATQLRWRLPARLKLVCVPAHSPLPTAALPSMSRVPRAPFPHSRRVLRRSSLSIGWQPGCENFAVRAVIFRNAVRKVDHLPVRRPSRRCSTAFRIRDKPRLGTTRVHDENLVAMATSVRCERDLPPIRRRHRPAIEERVVRKITLV